MINNKKKNPKSDNLVTKVVNIKNKQIEAADIDTIKSKIIDNPAYVDPTVKEATKDLVANYLKGSVAVEQPKYYDYFKNMPYDELTKHIKVGPKGNEMVFTVPSELMVNIDGSGNGLTPTSFSISQNSFWSNVTNILNVVTVGDNVITTGESFNAYEFFKSQTLASGEAVLRTMGTPLSGTFLLNQNQLVPQNTQVPKGYQASLGVFINVPSADDVGGGTGIGLFNMYSVPINVLKLAVTNPQQFAEMVRIFQATAYNSKMFTLWVSCTLNMLNSITNIIVDNYNNNIRNCLNGTLFPAIQIMKNPTNEFNCGLVGSYSVSGLTTTNNALPVDVWNQLTYSNINDVATMNAIQYTVRTPVNATVTWAGATTGNPKDTIGATTTGGNESNPLPSANIPATLVSGSENYPRIQSMSANDMYLIVSPEFLVGLKSGTLSQLFHFEFQRLEEYIKPDHIMMLYKTVNIPAGYLTEQVTNANNQTGYAQQVRATLGDRWIPKNAIYLITKPKDENMWTANYGDVWTTEMSNTWGAGMIGTNFLQYAFWGGMIPWSNGCGFYFKNLMTLISDDTAAVMTDFGLNTIAVQATITKEPGTGQN